MKNFILYFFFFTQYFYAQEQSPKEVVSNFFIAFHAKDTVALKKFANKVFRRTHELDWKVFNYSHGCKLINYNENEDVNFNFFVRPKRGTRSYTYERKYNRICYQAKWDGSIKKNK